MSASGVAEVMTRIEADLTTLASTDVSLLADRSVREGVLRLSRMVNQARAQLSVWAAVFEARDLAPADGCRNLRAFLATFCRWSSAATKALLSQGRVLRHMPKLYQAASTGQTTMEHVRPVVELVKDVPQASVTQADAIIAEVARTGSVGDMIVLCRRIRDLLDPDGPDPNKDYDKRTLSLRRAGNLITIRGRLDLDGGAAVISALDALMKPPTPSDERTADQRRADALGDLALKALDFGLLPEIHGERPHLGILTTPAALAANAQPTIKTTQLAGDAYQQWLRDNDPTSRSHSDYGNGTAGDGGVDPAQADKPYLYWAGEIPAETAQRLACDCDAWRLIMHERTGLPLDVGRAYRTAPYWMRKALNARDRGCRFPGCDTPPQWIDIHHLDHWIHGGHTRIDRLLSLCRFHHRLVHEGRWRLDLDPETGTVQVWRPDAIPYEPDPTHPYVGPHRKGPG